MAPPSSSPDNREGLQCWDVYVMSSALCQPSSGRMSAHSDPSGAFPSAQQEVKDARKATSLAAALRDRTRCPNPSYREISEHVCQPGAVTPNPQISKTKVESIY